MAKLMYLKLNTFIGSAPSPGWSLDSGPCSFFALHFFRLLTAQIDCYRNAIKDLSIGLSIESSNIECLYLRASCYHAVGQYREAVCWLSFLFSCCFCLQYSVLYFNNFWHLIFEFYMMMKVKDYDAALDLELDSMEKFVLQCLAFYQV